MEGGLFIKLIFLIKKDCHEAYNNLISYIPFGLLAHLVKHFNYIARGPEFESRTGFFLQPSFSLPLHSSFYYCKDQSLSYSSSFFIE